MIAGYKTINHHTKKPTGFVEKIENGTKIHTIRRGDRWSKAFEKAEKEGRAFIEQRLKPTTKDYKYYTALGAVLSGWDYSKPYLKDQNEVTISCIFEIAGC